MIKILPLVTFFRSLYSMKCKGVRIISAVKNFCKHRLIVVLCSKKNIATKNKKLAYISSL